MLIARLLTTLLLVCSASAFAQQQISPVTASTQTAVSSKSAQGTPSEPWRIVPNLPLVAGAGRNALDRLRTDEYKILQFKGDSRARVLSLDANTVSKLEGQPGAETTCYAIRSDVVARDNNELDSTHLVGSSTCQPTSRYHLRNAPAQPVRWFAEEP